MRTTVLAIGFVFASTLIASAAPHHASHRPARAVGTEAVTSPRTTGSIGRTPSQDFGLAGDPANWGRRGPGLPSPINPLGYTGE